VTRIDPPLPAVLALDGWAGRSLERVLVVGATPKRYVIRAPGPDAVRLAGRRRWLEAGNETRVPRTAVRIVGRSL
jgi:hypothetical protein